MIIRGRRTRPSSTVGGTTPVILTRALPANATSFQIPNGLLATNHNYTLAVQLIETRNHVDFSSNNNALIARRSYSFFDFTPLPAGAPAQVALPIVDEGVYYFNVRDVGPDHVTYIDPLVAIGYDYSIGGGDPNFASVLFPDVQDDPYLLSFPGDPNGNPVSILANQQFFFPAGGVDHFSVRGIDPSAGLDPNNTTAFITGLTFVADGDFTGTMTPVTELVGEVPEPSTLMLVVSGLAGLGGATCTRRFRRTR